MRLAFRLGQHFPRIVQIRKEALAQIDSMSPKRRWWLDRFIYALQPESQRLIHNLFQARPPAPAHFLRPQPYRSARP